MEGTYKMKNGETASQYSENTTASAPPAYSEVTGSQPTLGSGTDYDIKEVESSRGHWGGKAEFILSCLGYAVGLGNVWRFPYLCFQNGGGAFLIPYVIMLTFVGLPVFFMELSIGQYAAEGPVNAFLCSPLFQGVGVGMIIISFLGSIYYNMIIAWSLYYMFAGFTSELPWDGCRHDYNTAYCYSKKEAQACEDKNGTWFNQTCYTPAMLLQYPHIKNETLKNVSAPEEYFNRVMLERTDSIEDMGGLKWDLCLILLLAWVLCFLCIIKGIRSSGKVVYFTATFPYVILVILFFRGVTLTGAGEGIKFYLIPDFEKLLIPKVWGDAAGQIFFSLSVGMGGLMTFASYNKFHNNVFRDTLIVALGNCFTSFFAGFVIFSILGFMAHEMGVEVKDVAKSGSGLAFIAYPEVVTRLPVAPLWSFLFFFMLLLLGLDSQFAGLENIQTAIVDTWPRWRPYKTWVALGLCIVMYLLGLTMCARGGIYWEELMSYYSSGWSLVLIGLAECLVFAWVYGADRMLNDIEHMIGFKPSCNGRYWWFIWKFITPLLIIVILIFNFIEFTPLEYGDYRLPDWSQALGWMMALVSIVVIPIFAVYHIIKSYKYYDGTLWERIKWLSQPDPERWMPAIQKNKLEQMELQKSTGTLSTVTTDLKPINGNPSAANNQGFKGSQASIGQVSIESGV